MRGLCLSCILIVAGCAYFTPSHTADIVTLVGCVLTEAARVAPGRLPTLAEAAMIADTCGTENAQSVIDLVSAKRKAEAVEAAYVK